MIEWLCRSLLCNCLSFMEQMFGHAVVVNKLTQFLFINHSTEFRNLSLGIHLIIIMFVIQRSTKSLASYINFVLQRWSLPKIIC